MNDAAEEPVLDQVKKGLKARLKEIQLEAAQQAKLGELDRKEAQKLIAGEISGISYQPGRIAGQGTYQVVTDTRFSRQKLAKLGFVESVDYARKPLNDFAVQFSIKEKAMHRVLNIKGQGAEVTPV